jgi:oxygen-independent coproporphyrinogen III oxidase
MNAYLHIPFCTSICSYCDFTSFAGQEVRMDAYAQALVREIASSDLEGPLRTIYFGGGTPSLLSPGQLEGVLRALREKAGFAPGIEISLEANPETVDEQKLMAFRSLGVNRLSFGAQASQKEVLKSLGRGHDWEKVVSSFRAAREAGFQDLNLDLMMGLPGQTGGMFEGTLQEALALRPDHLSVYALQVEEGTPLAAKVREGLSLPSEDEVADEYALAQSVLEREGYRQYEVSNFARPGSECRHNLAIWRGEDYWGFGVGAVGTVKGVRTTHGEDLAAYLRDPLARALRSFEELSWETKTWERVLLGLRTREGVDRSEVEHVARERGIDPGPRFDRFLKEGLLHSQGERVAVTRRGYFVLNGILETLMA